MSGELRGLVIDWGGVLTLPLGGAMASWAERDAVDLAHFQDVMRTWTGRAGIDAQQREGTREGVVQDVDTLEESQSEKAEHSPVHLIERGELTVGEFEKALAVELAARGSVVEPEGLVTRMLSDVAALEDDMLGLVRRLRADGVRTALLSNSWGDHYPDALFDGLFDAVVISGRVGMRKPEPEIFLHTCALIDLPPSACVMVDDLAHNITAAVAVGMVGVRHTAYGTTAEELEILFDRSLR